MPDPTWIRNRSYEVSVVLPAAPARVFELLTTPAGLRSWWVDDAEVTGDPPTGMRLVWGSGAEAMVGEVSVQDYDRPRCFQTTWMRGGGREVRSDGSNHRGARVPIRQRYTLTATATGTLLHLLDTGFGVEPAYDPIYRATIDGWDRSFALLAAACGRSASGSGTG